MTYMSTQHVRPKSWEKASIELLSSAPWPYAITLDKYVHHHWQSILSGSLPHTVGRRLETFMGCSPHSGPIFLDIDGIPVFA